MIIPLEKTLIQSNEPGHPDFSEHPKPFPGYANDKIKAEVGPGKPGI